MVPGGRVRGLGTWRLPELSSQDFAVPLSFPGRSPPGRLPRPWFNFFFFKANRLAYVPSEGFPFRKGDTSVSSESFQVADKLSNEEIKRNEKVNQYIC